MRKRLLNSGNPNIYRLSDLFLFRQRNRTLHKILAYIMEIPHYTFTSIYYGAVDAFGVQC